MKVEINCKIVQMIKSIGIFFIMNSGIVESYLCPREPPVKISKTQPDCTSVEVSLGHEYYALLCWWL